jgi:transcriptional repressor NrdR
MRCPNCGTLDGRVIDSRDLDDSTTIRRRRECSSCRSRYTTYERVESARLVVVKTDGTREEFDRDKLAEGLEKALVRRPVGTDAADQAADEIEAALRAQGRNEVASKEIGQLAMERLRALDHIAFIRFMSVYQSFDDLEQLKREVDTLYEERSDRVPGQTTLRLVAEDGAITPIGPRGAPRRRPTKRK